MNIRTAVRPAFVGATLTLLTTGVANAAGVISTPIIFLGNANQIVCIANNVSNSSVKVRVRIFGNIGGTATETCTLPSGDTEGCQVFLNNEGGHCRISVKGLTDEEVRNSIRGVLFSRKTVSPFSSDFLVQAQ
jgi:hypothetical protein